MSRTTLIHENIQALEGYVNSQGLPLFMSPKQERTLVMLENKYQIKVLWEELYKEPSMVHASTKIANIIDAIESGKVQKRRIQLNRTIEDIWALYMPEEEEIKVVKFEEQLMIVRDYTEE